MRPLVPVQDSEHSKSCLVRLCVAVLSCCLCLTAMAETRGSSDQQNSADFELFECLIEPWVVLQLGSETQGVVDTLVADRGASVKAGDVVARLRSSVEQSNVVQARARATMQSEIEARKADLELAGIVLERARSLHAQQLAPSQELDEARAQYRVSSSALHQAEDNLAQLELELQRAQALLAQKVVRSPVDGVVVEQHTFAGEFVHDNPIMTIAQLHPLRVEVVLPASQFGRFATGDQALIIPELGELAIEARVEVVDPLLDTRSGTFGMRLVLNNEKQEIVAGQKCQVQLNPHTTSIAQQNDDR